MLRNEECVRVARRKHRARVKRHAERSHMRAGFLHRRFGGRASPLRAELRVGDVALMTEWETEVKSRLPGDVDLVGGYVVAHAVATIVREPELVRRRMPIEADAVAYAF